MTTTVSKHERQVAALIHAGTFSKFLIPFGNFIIPLVLWAANKKTSEFVDYNGKQALNFQISLFLYTVLIGVLTVPFLVGFIPSIFDFDSFNLFNPSHYNNLDLHWSSDGFGLSNWLFPIGIAGLLKGALFIVNLVYTILATIKSNDGEHFEYPITIKFLK